jgi:4-hydroxy-3-polyprenylbenzoate decarboxylase
LKLIVGLSGASGVIYGVRFLEVAKTLDVETHLVMSPAAALTLSLETRVTAKYVESLATYVYRFRDIAATLASGSHPIDAMVVIPCSMKTLAGIVHGYADNLLLRAAEVTLKERRPLVLVPREAPLSLIHLRNQLAAGEAGAIILPAMPGFYHRPTTMQELIDHVVGKVWDVLQVKHNLYERWTGPRGKAIAEEPTEVPSAE